MIPSLRLLFPGDPARPGRIDPDWDEESAAAAEEGIASAVVDMAALLAGDFTKAVARVRPGSGEVVVYRGPPLSADALASLDAALRPKGLRLVTPPPLTAPTPRALLRLLRNKIEHRD